MISLARIVLLTTSLAICSAALTGCNTTEGFGKDVKAAGKAIEDEAKENKSDLLTLA